MKGFMRQQFGSHEEHAGPTEVLRPRLPVFNNSDSDQDLYELAEEIPKQEDKGDEQVGVRLHVSFAWLVSASTNNPKVAATV